MADAHMSQSDFFERLTKLFDARQGKDHGAIYLVQKRLSYGSEVPSDKPLADLIPPSPLPVLIRATNGNPKKSKTPRVKLSTIVQPDDLEAFFIRYADCCKAGMQGLRKRDRKAKKKDKGKKKKGGAEATSRT